MCWIWLTVQIHDGLYSIKNVYSGSIKVEILFTS
jgi:hypothetical protein